MELNVRAPVELTRLVLPQMQSRNAGTIIFTSSRAARAHLPFTTAYSCSKSAISMFAGWLQAELDIVQKAEGGFAENGIEVFSFHPGEIHTDLHKSAFPSNLKTEAPYVLELMNNIEARRPKFEPELPAGTAVFLAAGMAGSLKGRYIDCTLDIEEALKSSEN